jgi:hypothetical protein
VPQTGLKERLAEPGTKRDDLDVDERDMQTVMETLYDIRSDTLQILALLREDDDEEEEETDR